PCSFFFQAEDGIRDSSVTGVQTCALPILRLGATGVPVSLTARLWTSALTAGAIGWCIKLLLPTTQPIVVAAAVLIPYGLVFLGKIGRASCRERVWVSGVGGSMKDKDHRSE